MFGVESNKKHSMKVIMCEFIATVSEIITQNHTWLESRNVCGMPSTENKWNTCCPIEDSLYKNIAENSFAVERKRNK